MTTLERHLRQAEIKKTRIAFGLFDNYAITQKFTEHHYQGHKGKQPEEHRQIRARSQKLIGAYRN